jgi:FKBP-type peptidyl-prolyl cis-trans isomerase FkpA
MQKYIIFGVIAVIIIIGAVMLRPAQPASVADSDSQPTETQVNLQTTTMPNGLKIEDVKVGEGAMAVAGKKVTVNYVGTFTDGKKFDASADHGTSGFTFTLGAGQVIQGWDEGVAGMKVGGMRKLTVPPELGYGPNTYGPIPGNSTLLFDVELLAVN